MKKLSLGKIPIDVLNSSVLRLTGARSAMVVTPPKAGLDFAAVKVGGGYLIVSADPITGVREDIGSYAVKVSANDVATSGNRPQFMESVVLLPEGSAAGDVEKIAMQIHRASRESSIAIVGGHTEVTPGLLRPVVVMTAFGFVDNFVTSGDAQGGDSIMMTKTAGLEGTAALAGGAAGKLSSLGSRGPSTARRFLSKLSIVDEATAAYKTGAVSAMHDCTEGGVLGAVFEMSLASGTGFMVDADTVPVARETALVCDELSLDPLRLIGSGSLLIAARSGREGEVEAALRPVCKVTKIGEFVGGKRVVLEGGRERAMSTAPEDELWRALGRRT